MKNFTKQLVFAGLALLSGLYACRTLPTETRIRHSYEHKERNRPDRPDLALQQDLKRTKDPALGYVPHERALKAFEYTKRKTTEKAALTGVNWTERGPNNIGGRTRALMYDPNDAANGYKKVWAGGVAGGLWYNNDITDANSSWYNVNDFWANMAISTIAYDPSNTQVFYVGTGEGWYNVDAVRGAGIWKTTDGGATWNQLASSVATFLRVQKIVVTSTGTVVVADRNNGIYRSTNGGTSWINEISGEAGADIEKAANGDLYCTTGVFSAGKIYKSTDEGDTWTNLNYGAVTGTANRIEIACAPSASGTIYAVGHNGDATGNNDVSFIKRSTDSGANWTTITRPGYITNTTTCAQSATHFTRGQAWFDLILQVHPTNSAILLAGGVDLFRSIDATDTPGTNVSWSPLSYWTGVSCNLPIVHADQHAIIFHPTDPNKVIFGNDGGVFYSPDAGDSGVTTPSISARIKNYNVTQFYAVSTPNVKNSSYYVAGAQDNGSLIMNGFQAKPGREGTGGDGAYCFVDQDNPDIVVTAYTNNYFYASTDGGYSFASVLADGSTGDFINPAAYDSQANILYTNKSVTPAASPTAMYRVTGIGGTPASSSPTITVSGAATYISAIKVSPHTANTIFVATDNGFVYRVANAHTGNMTAVRIGSATAIAAGTVSSIDVGASDAQLLITFSNYGINSVFETSNANLGNTATWTNKDAATLPDMPIRWGLYNPSNRNQAMLATEAGIYSTDNLNNATPVWGPTVNNLANVRCDMLHYRAIDKTVVAASHARGLFTTDVWADPYADFDYTRTSCNTIQFNDGSLKPNNSWAWDVDGNGTTDYTTQNPSHTYSTAGVYSVRLTIGNGTSTTTKTNYINVIGTAPATSSCVVTNNFNMGNALGITRVILNTIDNITPPDNGTYQDYSCSQATTLLTNTAYTLTIYMGDGTNSMGYRAFIDYNGDGDFVDAGEEIGNSGAVSTNSIQTLNFTTATSPSKGVNLRMRIITRTTNMPTSCSGAGSYGQAEDYAVIFADALTWTGNTSTNWNTASNWSPATVPTSFNDVTLPTGRPNYPNLTTATPVCKNFTINNGASLTLGEGGSLSVRGDFSCAGTLTYAGTTVQNAITQVGAISGNMVVNNAAGVKLWNNLTVTGTLTIQSGTLDLNNYDVDLGTAGTLSENRASNAYVLDNTSGLSETNKGGMIRVSSRTTNGTLTQIAGTGIHLSNAGTVSIDRYHYRGSGFAVGGTIRKVYDVTGTPTNATMRIEYTAGERAGMAQNASNVKLFRHDGSTWVNQGGTWTSATPAYAEGTNVNAFSPWTIGNSVNPLPITLLSFAGKRESPENVKLTWQTKNEINNAGFEIERSLDAVNFEKIGFVDGLGTDLTGKEYSYLDRFREGAYYRFKQIDINKSFSYSPIVFVESAEPETWKIYPNPTRGEVKVTIPRKALAQGKVAVRVVSLSGQQLASFEALPEKVAQELTQALQKLEVGTYIIEGKTNTERWQQKIIKQ